MLALSLATGIVIDAAIVVLENNSVRRGKRRHPEATLPLRRRARSGWP